MKWYDVKISNVTLIGNFPYFKNTDKVEISDMGFGHYKGIEIKKRNYSSIYNGEVYKTKTEAIEKAKRNYENNMKFADGTIPFEIVFYLSGWQIFTSNTVSNAHLVRKLMKDKRRGD